MALSTRARIAGVGGALAIGLLGAGGVAYATGGDATGAPSYVTVVDEGTAPATPGGTADREDCPEGAGGSGSGTGSPGGTGTPAVPGDA